MATVASRLYLDIENLQQGGDVFPGITQAQVSEPLGVAVPVLKEGSLKPTGIEYLPARDLLTITVTSESENALIELAAKSGDVTFDTRDAGASAKQRVTVTAVRWESRTLQASRDRYGIFSMSGKGLTVTAAPVA